MKPPARRVNRSPDEDLLDDVEDLGLTVRNRHRRSAEIRRDPWDRERTWEQLPKELQFPEEQS